jgi:hypothetical protein
MRPLAAHGLRAAHREARVGRDISKRRHTTDHLARHGTSYIREACSKALSRREQDPEGAITNTRTLLEEVCRHILDDSTIAYDSSDDLPKL